MIEPLRMGVVGLGIRGFHLAHLITRIQETELVAMADMQDKMLDIAREKFPGVELYESGAAMAEKADIEAVLVATGDRFHAGNACEALENGKHVLIEKPMAQTFDDIIQIAQLQKQTGLTVGMFLEMRLNGIWQRAKAIIEAGELGEIYAGSLVDHVGRDRAQFFARLRTRSRDVVVSLPLQKGVHSLDLLNWFMGASPRRVGAVGGLFFFGGDQPADKRCRDCPERETCPHAHTGAPWRLPALGIEIQSGEDYCVWSEACDVEDVTFINIEYTSGTVANYREVHFAPFYSLHFTLYGSKAQLDIEANHDTGEAWIEVTERYTRNQRRERPTRDTGHGNADTDLLIDYARAVREGRSPTSDLRAGFESAAIPIGARKSLDEGTFVDLPLLDEI